MQSGEPAANYPISIVKYILPTLFIGLNAHAINNDPCSLQSLDEFRAAAQMQNPKTESLYKNIKDCGALRSEVLIWMSYYDRTVGGNSTRLLENDSESSDALSERDALIAKANRNQYQPLEEVVYNESSSYHHDAEAILVLARAFTRGSEFTKARECYLNYLKLKPDDTEIEVEYAYTFLWAGDTKNAEKNLKDLEINSKNAEQSRAAREGLKRLKLMGHPAFSDIISRLEHFSVGLERYNNNFFNFSRTSTLLEYGNKGWLLLGSADFLNSSQYSNAGGGGLTGSKSFALSPTVSSYVKLGFFSAGKGGVPVFHLNVKKETKSGLIPGIGYYNEALAHDVPLPSSNLNWSRSAFYGRLQFKQWLDYRIEFRSLGSGTGGTTSTDHQVHINIPIKANEDGSHPLELYILAENEAFTKASTFVYSPNSYTALKGGLLYQDRMNDEMDLKLNLEYGPFYESAAKTSALTYGSAANLLGIGGAFTYKLEPDLFANFKFRYDRTQSDEAGTTYAATVFGLNVTWLLQDEP